MIYNGSSKLASALVCTTRTQPGWNAAAPSNSQLLYMHAYGAGAGAHLPCLFPFLSCYRTFDSSPLLQLPDPCLLAVLQYCADDPRSLFSAARVHSRLHQAAVQTLSSIKAVVNQHIADMMVYLAKYGSRIDSIELQTTDHDDSNSEHSVTLHQLPPNLLKLSSLTFIGQLHLQLHQGSGCQGVLGAGPPLKQLVLDGCVLLDGGEGLRATLQLLPELQHLSITGLKDEHGEPVGFSFRGLQDMVQLTYLELSGCAFCNDHPNLQHLSHLQDLRLALVGRRWFLDTVMVSGLQRLTRFEIHGTAGTFGVKPDILLSQTQLQHLALRHLRVDGAGPGVQQLLLHLQQMQRLTYLDFRARPLHRFFTLQASAPPAAYSALTASSKLQHLDISGCKVPAGVWEHMFPAGKQLPHLRVLNVAWVAQSGLCRPAAAPDSSRLVSCCPGLQTLDIEYLQYSSELLAPLTGLSSLQHLSVAPCDESTEGLEVVCQLTGLRQLEITDPSEAKGLLLQLTQLRQLTSLTYMYGAHVWSSVLHRLQPRQSHRLRCQVCQTDSRSDS
jgi:hypothetical protein